MVGSSSRGQQRDPLPAASLLLGSGEIPVVTDMKMQCWEGFHRLLVCPGCWKQSADALSALTPTPVVLCVFVLVDFSWQLRLGLIYQEEGKAFVEPE